MPESLSLRSSTVYGNRSVTVVPYVRGLNGIEEMVSRVHSEMAEYNSIEKVSLLEVCPDLPAALDQVIGDRITLHILVNCYDNLDEKKVNASADIKSRTFSRRTSISYRSSEAGTATRCPAATYRHT